MRARQKKNHKSFPIPSCDIFILRFLQKNITNLMEFSLENDKMLASDFYVFSSKKFKRLFGKVVKKAKFFVSVFREFLGMVVAVALN